MDPHHLKPKSASTFERALDEVMEDLNLSYKWTNPLWRMLWVPASNAWRIIFYCHTHTGESCTKYGHPLYNTELHEMAWSLAPDTDEIERVSKIIREDLAVFAMAFGVDRRHN